jgi:hypothetical protein
MSQPPLVLTGLDGSNPLAFLAALGVLRVLDYRARQYARPIPKLSWVDDGCWRPVLLGPPGVDAVIGEVIEDKATWSNDPAFLLAYDESGEMLLDPRDSRRKATRDLKPRPDAMRAFLDGLASRTSWQCSPSELPLLRRALDTAAAYGSELVQDNNGNTKPTAFHFTAGQQQFMKAVSELQVGVDDADLREALVGPWLRESTLPNMSWDSTNARFYALRATNPSGDKKTTVAGADWLAFIGLGLLPSFPREGRLMTTCIKGGWKNSQFTWPVWEGPCTRRVASSIIRAARLRELSPGERRARGIAAVFTSSISRSEQGGYGSFSPAEVA